MGLSSEGPPNIPPGPHQAKMPNGQYEYYDPHPVRHAIYAFAPIAIGNLILFLVWGYGLYRFVRWLCA